MLTHWINELMNLLAGNAVYVHHSPLAQVGFVLAALLFWVVTLALMLFV